MTEQILNKNSEPINQFDENGLRDGYWVKHYHQSKQLWYKGHYMNGLSHGYWESYFSNGILNYKGYYNRGHHCGYWRFYKSIGELSTVKYYI